MGLKALLIEDSASWYENFMNYLKDSGFDEVDLATTYEDAMRLSENKYDLVVCDTLEGDSPNFPWVINHMRDRGIDTAVIANSREEECVEYWEGIENIQFVEKSELTSGYIRKVVSTLNK